MDLELIDRRGSFGHATLDFVADKMGIHLQITRWSHGALKEMLSRWPEIENMAKDKGCTEIVISNPDFQDKRWPKLIKRFGFQPPTIVQFSRKELR